MVREEQLETTRRRRGLLDDVPHPIKRARGLPERRPGVTENTDEEMIPDEPNDAPAADDIQEVNMVARRCSERGKEKQLEKEIPWEQIPPDEREEYRKAEATQWQEHLDFQAVRPFTLDESQEVRATAHPSRILRSRYAYRDKNHSLRQGDPSLGPRAKARLCVSGQLDPDLTCKDMSVDAPTASRQSVLLAIQLALSRRWAASIGDIRAAFLNGVQAPRQLYFTQPKRGIRGMPEGALIEILKGVFGLATSPKLWWLQLSTKLLATTLQTDQGKVSIGSISGGQVAGQRV